MSEKNERFEVTYKQGVLSQTKVIVDKETGVNYIFHCDGNAGGLSILVDRDGKPVVTR